jgi:signal transduction histidine kinase
VDRAEALGTLGSGSWHDRLKAARALGTTAATEDLAALQEARAGETVSYVQRLLDSAIRRIRRDLEDIEAADAESVPPSVMRQVHARAVEEVTRTVLHEVENIAGALSLAASREIADYEASATKRQIDRLEKQLEAIIRLKAAAAAPKLETFAVGEWIKQLVAEEAADAPVEISLVGPENLLVEGDPKLLRLAVCNGLKNALEAVAEKPGEPDAAIPPVVVSWDGTDVECWVTIKDEGPGLSGAATDAMPIGRTTKAGHPGMGLMTAKQAMDSHGGSISLTSGALGGALFEIRWFGP